MRKRVKKQLRDQEKGRYGAALAKIHQLEVENANLLRAIHICDEENKRLKAMFEQLQTEYEELEVSSGSTVAERDLAICELRDKIHDQIATIDKLGDAIDELLRPRWRKWLSWLRRIGN